MGKPAGPTSPRGWAGEADGGCLPTDLLAMNPTLKGVSEQGYCALCCVLCRDLVWSVAAGRLHMETARWCHSARW